MFNILLDELPNEWNGYEVNTWYQIGIQVFLAKHDEELNDFEKFNIIIDLMFDDRPHPIGEELQECIEWFLNGWYTDNKIDKEEKKRSIDFDKDQYRIYADFLSIYRIDLKVSNMHWWEFNGLLWNLPHDLSSFMQVIEIRNKEIKSNMGAEEKKAIREAKKIYSIEQEVVQELSEEDELAIDDFDKMFYGMEKGE